MALRLGGKARATLARIEDKLRASEVLLTKAVALNLGLDRTTIPMAEDEKTPNASGVSMRRVLRYRIAYVGTFCVTDRNGEVLLTRRYAAPAHAGAASVLSRLRSDLRSALKQNPALNIGVVQDGAAELWNRMRSSLLEELSVPGRWWGVHLWRRLPWRETIDWYHLMNHLSAALHVLVPLESARHERLDSWKAMLSRDDQAIKKIRGMA